MKIFETTYKDIQAITAETETLIARFLPSQGGKLASLICKANGAELLAQAEGDTYKLLNMTSSYVDSECSAFDDMFPNIDPQDARYPCHGEVCRSRHSYEIARESLKLHCISALLPYVFEKTVAEGEDGSLKLSYSVENLGVVPLDCLWAGHIMLAACEDGEIGVPFASGAQIEFTFDEQGEFGVPGKPTALSRDMLRQRKYDTASGNTYKFYFTDKLTDGRLTYTRPDLGKTVAVTIDQIKVPYLGVWLNNGRFKGMYNAALEPCTAPFDNPQKAKSRGYGCSIAPGKKLEFDIKIAVN
jgi:hypothetical protein